MRGETSWKKAEEGKEEEEEEEKESISEDSETDL